jgi:hypothetical protein
MHAAASSASLGVRKPGRAKALLMQSERAVQTLCGTCVGFVIIGLSAASHGSAHVTDDLNVCYSRSSANLRLLAADPAPFHPRPRGFSPGLIQTDRGEIDLLAEVAGLGAFEDVKRLPGTYSDEPRADREQDLSALIRIENLLEAEDD